MDNIVNSIYKQRGNFIIIGLTGRTGSGCTKVAELLSAKSFEDLNPNHPIENTDSITNEDLKYNILFNYMKANWNEGFQHIKVRDIITSFIIEINIYDWNDKIKLKDKLKERTINLYEKLHKNISESKKKLDSESSRNYLEIIDKCLQSNPRFLIELSILSKYIREDISINTNESYSSIYQEIGDNIRRSGNANCCDIDLNKLSSIAERINCIIKFIRNKNNNTLVVIDAFRNPFEIFYFRERYSAFYLMAVNTTEEIRKNRLYKIGLNKEQIKVIDNREYPDKKKLEDSYTSQNISKCIEISDIHLVNDDCNHGNFHQIKSQLLKYISLIKHPGLITPTAEERTMQIAYTAKFNSGCISRQVGAVVTDKNFSIKSIGWNDVPEGQTPCLLKNGDDLINGKNKVCYSNYELETSEFKNILKDSYKNTGDLNGKNISFCFKDTYNLLTGEKNQVHTRSLHAEENAFLQISKYGGTGINGGKLFTTASPCELCAKKAYQLGIKDIYYIDIYPGISMSHILNNGKKRPNMHLFNGAIGRAYIHMYQPILSYKDELYNILNFDFKNELKTKQKENIEKY